METLIILMDGAWSSGSSGTGSSGGGGMSTVLVRIGGVGSSGGDGMTACVVCNVGGAVVDDDLFATRNRRPRIGGGAKS